MVITVSDIGGVKQYSAPKSIKKILLFALLFIVVLVGGLFIYIQILNSKYVDLEQDNKILSKKIEDDSSARESFEQKLLELDTLKKEKLLLTEKLKEKKSVLLKSIEEKSKSDKLLDELKKEIKLIEKELKKEIKFKEKLKKKLSLKIKKKKEKIKKEKKRKKRLVQKKRKREKLLANTAKKKLGKKYVWGAVGPRTFDCSGFTSYVYKRLGVYIPRTSRQQSKYGKRIKRKYLKTGDLIFFDTSRQRKGIVNHVGIYIGNNKFIHASSAKNRVIISSLNKTFYGNRYKWARRVIN